MTIAVEHGAPGPASLRHEAWPYAGHVDLVTSAVTILRDGLDRDERPLLLTSQATLDDVRHELGDDVQDVSLVATDEHFRNPSRLLTLLAGFCAGSAGRRSLAVSESVLAGQSASVRAEAHLGEAVINHPALQHWSLSLICLFDSAALDADDLDLMSRCHPVLRGDSADNPGYDDDVAEQLFRRPLAAPPATAGRLDVAGRQLAEVRDFVRAGARADGVAPDRVDDLVLAVNEVVTNSQRHGGGRCSLTLWCEDASVLCQVQDAGVLQDTLTGRLAPPPQATGGRGLWLAHHLCDLVQIRSSARIGTIVRLAVDAPAHG